jgi:hypothetical protein
MTLASLALSPLCPHGALPLPANAIGPAAAAALRREDPKTRPLVVSTTLASRDNERGPEAKRQCGSLVWSRTVVVYIDLRAFHPSASLSERVDFVSRFRNGWRVWEVVH